jgi:hypothetical protein
MTLGRRQRAARITSLHHDANGKRASFASRKCYVPTMQWNVWRGRNIPFTISDWPLSRPTDKRLSGRQMHSLPERGTSVGVMAIDLQRVV